MRKRDARRVAGYQVCFKKLTSKVNPIQQIIKVGAESRLENRNGKGESLRKGGSSSRLKHRSELSISKSQHLEAPENRHSRN